MDKQKWLAFAKKIDGISDWTGRVFCWLVIPLTVLRLGEFRPGLRLDDRVDAIAGGESSERFVRRTVLFQAAQ